MGVAQWRMLRAYWPCAYRWIVASTLGFGLLTLFQLGAPGWTAPSVPIGVSASSLWFRVVMGLLYGGYVGLVLGTMQWLAMRSQIAKAWRWVPLSSGIWAVAIAFGWLIGGSLRVVSHLFVSEVVGLMVAWGAIAALSGIGIVGLLYQAPASQPSANDRTD